MNENFHIVRPPHGELWVHKSWDFWIVEYPFMRECGKPSFSSYRALVPPQGRDPWAVANKNIGDFMTLDEAMAAIERRIVHGGAA